MSWFKLGNISVVPIPNNDVEETNDYYKEYIYYDRYGIFDYVKDK